MYDPWLYPVFESMGLAEPRSEWLARALETGPVRLIVTAAPQTRIDGIPRGLPELGYTPATAAGPLAGLDAEPSASQAQLVEPIRRESGRDDPPVLLPTLSVKQPTCYTRGSRRTNSLIVVFERTSSQQKATDL